LGKQRVACLNKFLLFLACLFWLSHYKERTFQRESPNDECAKARVATPNHKTDGRNKSKNIVKFETAYNQGKSSFKFEKKYVHLFHMFPWQC
jgi:hypothetical protein